MSNIKKALPILFSIVGSAGVVATSYLVATETIKEYDKIKEISKIKGKKTDKLVKSVKMLFPIYWPSILAGGVTVSSIVASTILSKKTEASLIATSAVLSQGWNKYKYKVKDILGIKGEKKLTDIISADEYSEQKLDEKQPKKQLYYEEHLGFFECDPVDFMSAINDMNQRLHSPDPDPDNGTFYWTTLEKFISDANADVYDKEKLNGCKNIGWTSDYLLDVYGAQNVWIHPTYTNVIDPNNNGIKYIKLDFWEEPIELASKNMVKYNNYHTKTKNDFDHDSELDVHSDYFFGDSEYLRPDWPQNDEKLISEKPDCDRIDDNLDHFMTSNPNDPSNYKNIYSDENNK